MLKFKNKNDLTEEEWYEIVKPEKVFKPGDIVEYGPNDWSDKKQLSEVVKYVREHGIQGSVYKLKRLVDGELLYGTTGFMCPIGTFIDTKLLEVIKNER